MEGRIYVITHKRVNIPMLAGHSEYEMIQTGNNQAKNLGYQTASTGRNIADENQYYADLTVHYWIWKNGDYDYVGINHYRRFLFYENHLITDHEIKALLEKYDILVPRKINLGRTVEEQWNLCHTDKDLILARESLKKHYPLMMESFTTVINQNALHICNIFIAKQAIFNKYLEWVFPILEDVKSQIDLTKYSSDAARRVGGFLSERLFNVWLYYTKHSMYELEFRVYPMEQFDIK